MSMEQRLQRAFEVADQVEPSTDLWSRVLYSIEEDRAHRRRILRAVVGAGVVCAALAGALVASLREAPSGSHYVPWQVMELIELGVLVAVAFTFAPAIRRFGRGFADDLWIGEPTTPRALLQLLDVAYALVIAGYVLITTRFEPDATVRFVFAEQLHEATDRLGGELLLIGLLHAVTMMALPLVALVSNSTRRSRKLPRFAVVLIALGLVAGGFVVLQILGGVIALGSP
jgi:hypothetical protein